MTLYQIEYFKAVVESGSISKAAEDLCISRPAVSKALRELECEYGVELIVRTSSGITLTEAGIIFYENCNEIQKSLNQLRIEMSTLRDTARSERKKRLKVGLSPATGFAVFPDFCMYINERFPSIILEPRELSYKTLMMMMEDGSIDLCLSMSAATGTEHVEGIKFMEKELFYCCNIHHELAGRKAVTILDIVSEPLVQLEGEYHKGMDAKFVNMFRLAGEFPNIVFHTTQASMARSMVSRGLCSSAQFPDVMEGNSDIVMLPFEPPIKYQVNVFWNESLRHGSEFKKVIDHLKARESTAVNFTGSSWPSAGGDCPASPDS